MPIYIIESVHGPKRWRTYNGSWRPRRELAEMFSERERRITKLPLNGCWVLVDEASARPIEHPVKAEQDSSIPSAESKASPASDAAPRGTRPPQSLHNFMLGLGFGDLARAAQWFVVENGQQIDIHARIHPPNELVREITVVANVELETADAICTAHNSHDALVAALQESRGQICLMAGDKYDIGVNRVKALIDAALSLVESQS